jgi:hypothetical protein
MSGYDSDALDEACQEILGHDLKKQFEHYDKVKDNIAHIVVFWKEPEEYDIKLIKRLDEWDE